MAESAGVSLLLLQRKEKGIATLIQNGSRTFKGLLKAQGNSRFIHAVKIKL